MMMYVLALLASLWTADTCDAAVCRCWTPATAQAALDSSDAVFTGVVVGARDDPQPAHGGGWFRRTHVTLRVEAAWKGVEAPEMVVVNAGTDCDYELREGMRYMVYAIQHPTDRFLIAGVCSRTHRVVSYQDDVDVRVMGPPVRWWSNPPPDAFVSRARIRAPEQGRLRSLRLDVRTVS